MDLILAGSMIKSQILLFKDDNIEVFSNSMLSFRPYLLRLTGWNNYYELRASKEELKELADCLYRMIEDADEY